MWEHGLYWWKLFPSSSVEKWASPAFFWPWTPERPLEFRMKPTSQEIETRLAELDSGIEFLALEGAGGDGLRIVVDHPEGVTLELCKRVTDGLSDLLTEHSLEVSSPGPERPLTRPAHFARFAGRRAKVTTTEPIDGRRNFTGIIRESDEQQFRIECDGVVFRIPYEDVERSHLVQEIPEGAAK